MIYFDDYQAELCASRKNLCTCAEVIALYQREKEKNNPYRQLARDFERFEALHDCPDQSDNACFYRYLKSLCFEDGYRFPKKDLSSFEVKIPIFQPYQTVTTIDGKELRMVDPRWHYVVSYHAWWDAVYNHQEDENVKGIQYIPKRRAFKNDTMKQWLKDSKISNEKS